jgi:hypothetical protein
MKISSFAERVSKQAKNSKLKPKNSKLKPKNHEKLTPWACTIKLITVVIYRIR